MPAHRSLVEFPLGAPIHGVPLAVVVDFNCLTFYPSMSFEVLYSPSSSYTSFALPGISMRYSRPSELVANTVQPTFYLIPPSARRCWNSVQTLLFRQPTLCPSVLLPLHCPVSASFECS